MKAPTPEPGDRNSTHSFRTDPVLKKPRMIRSGRSHTMDPTLNPPGVFSPRKPAPTLLARHEFIRSYSSLVPKTDSQRDHVRRLRISRHKLVTVTREKTGIGSLHHSFFLMTPTFLDSICQRNEKVHARASRGYDHFPSGVFLVGCRSYLLQKIALPRFHGP